MSHAFTCENRMVIQNTSDQLENYLIEMEIDPYTILYLEENSILFGFDSENAPPIDLFEDLQKKGYNVVASFHIPETNTVGYWNYQNGLEVFNYDFSDPDWEIELPQNLCDEFDLELAYKDWLQSEKELDFDA